MTSALKYTTHRHALADNENDEARAVLNQVDKSDTLNSSTDTQPASVSMDITQSSLVHDGLGARAEDDAAVTTQIEITNQGGQEEHSGMAAGDDGQYNTGESQETTLEGPDITPATGKTSVPSVSINDTLVNSMANNGSGARTEIQDAITDQGVIVSQEENAEQSRMTGRGAGQLTTGATEPPGGMSSGDLSMDPRSQAGPGALQAWARADQKGSRVVHRRRAHRLRLRIIQHQSRWDPRCQRQIRRDGAWVRREQTRGSWDPSAHLREAPTNRYSGYQQPFPPRVGSQSAHAMLLGRKSRTGVPH